MLAYFAAPAPCLIGIEACAGAHHCARELIKLGHDARLMAAQFVRAYRKSGKNDANDAEAISGRRLMAIEGVGPSLPRLLWPAWVAPAPSAAAGGSPRGWGSRRDAIPVAARQGL